MIPTPSVQTKAQGKVELREEARVAEVHAPAPDFREIYATHRDYVWHTLRRLSIPERHLEDLTHDVFLVVHRRWHSYDPGRPLRPWILGIVVREASTFRRKASHRREQLVEREVLDTARSPEDEAVAQQARRLVSRALQTLHSDQRVAFVLHDINGESAPTIADALDVPLNTVYSRIRLARRAFEKAVRRAQAQGTPPRTHGKEPNQEECPDGGAE